MIFCSQFGLPAGFDHDGLVGLDDDSRTFDARSGVELIAGVYIRLVPLSGREKLRTQRWLRQGPTRAAHRLFSKFCTAADRFNRYGLDDQLLRAVDETESCPVGLFE